MSRSSKTEISVDKKDKLIGISNERCTLVEFVNEENCIETGFVAWMEEKDIDEIDEIISNEKIIKLFWPQCNISSAASLKTALMKTNFNQYPAKILAKGSKCHVIN